MYIFVFVCACTSLYVYVCVNTYLKSCFPGLVGVIQVDFNLFSSVSSPSKKESTMIGSGSFPPANGY